jgi:hypothetical protein
MKHLNSHFYNNVNLFIEGCVKDATTRQVPPLDINPPGYCYQHNESVYKQLIALGLNSVSERVTRKAVITVKQFEENV